MKYSAQDSTQYQSLLEDLSQVAATALEKELSDPTIANSDSLNEDTLIKDCRSIITSNLPSTVLIEEISSCENKAVFMSKDSIGSQVNISSSLPESFRLDVIDDLFDDSDRLTMNELTSNIHDNFPKNPQHFLISERSDAYSRELNNAYESPMLFKDNSLESLKGHSDFDRFHRDQELRDSVAHLNRCNQTNKDRSLYQFNEFGPETPFNTPTDSNIIDTMSRPLSRSMLPIERGLRLITSESSVQGNFFSKDGVDTLNKRRKASIINHSDFNNLDKGDLERLFFLEENIVSPRSNFNKNDEVTDFTPKEFDTNLDGGSLNRKPELSVYNNVNSERSPTEKTQDTYSVSSLIDVFANGFERNFPLSTDGYEDGNNQDKLIFDKNEDFMKSLNSVFDMDENFFDELNKANELLSLIENDLPSSPSPVPSITTNIVSESHHEEDGFFSSYLQSGLFSSTTEKLTDLFQRFSSRLVSSSAIDSQIHDDDYRRGIDNEAKPNVSSNSKVISKESQSMNIHKSLTSSYDTATKILDNAITSTTLDDSLIVLSAPGSITAKLYSENGLSVYENAEQNKSTLHFLEHNYDIESHTESHTEKSIMKLDSNQSVQVNEWAVNNKFVTPKKEVLRKRKTIRKILISALSKDSSSTTNLESNSKKNYNVQTEKKRWGLFHKQRITSHFSLESGESLKGYAAEYVSNNDLILPNSSEFISNDTEVARKIIKSQSHSGGIFGSEIALKVLPVAVDSITSNLNSTIDGGLDEKVTSQRALDEIENSRLPEFKRHKSLFCKNSSFDRTTDGLSSLIRKKSTADFINVTSKQSTIRFAPTPEYIPDSEFISINESSRSVSSFRSSLLGSFSNISRRKKSQNYEDTDEEEKKCNLEDRDKELGKPQMKRSTSIFNRFR